MSEKRCLSSVEEKSIPTGGGGEGKKPQSPSLGPSSEEEIQTLRLITESVLLVAFTVHISSSNTFASAQMRVVCDSMELISSGLVFGQMGIFQTSLVEHQHQGSCLTF